MCQSTKTKPIKKDHQSSEPYLLREYAQGTHLHGKLQACEGTIESIEL